MSRTYTLEDVDRIDFTPRGYLIALIGGRDGPIVRFGMKIAEIAQAVWALFRAPIDGFGEGGTEE